jgi:hypothetical protein
MWTIIISAIVILAALFGFGIYKLFTWTEKMDHSNAVGKTDYSIDLPAYFSEEKPCGAIAPSVQFYPCDISGDAYQCSDCSLVISN